MKTMCAEENKFEEKCEIINKLKTEILNDQVSGLLIKNISLSLKMVCVYYDDSSLFGDINCIKILKNRRFTKETVMKNTLSLMNIGKCHKKKFGGTCPHLLNLQIHLMCPMLP